MNSAQRRDRVYKFLEKLLGRNLSELEHNELRGYLIDYVEHSRKTNPNISNHVFICQKCYGVTMGYGREFFKTVRIWNNHAYDISQKIKRNLRDKALDDQQ